MSEFENTLNKLLSDPEQMEKIMGVAKSFMQSNDNQKSDDGESDPINPSALLSNLDPKMMGVIAKLMGELNTSGDKEPLLNAIAPYLKDSRRDQIRKAAEMAKYARLAKLAIDEFGGGR